MFLRIGRELLISPARIARFCSLFDPPSVIRLQPSLKREQLALANCFDFIVKTHKGNINCNKVGLNQLYLFKHHNLKLRLVGLGN